MLEPNLGCRRIAVGGLGAVLMWGCAVDRIQAGPLVCGDGYVFGAEECDTDSPGCEGCQILPGWTCEDNFCEPCGSRRAAEGCDDAAAVLAVKEEPCDMTGYWLARQTDFSRDSVLGMLQTSSTWYVYRFEQDESGVFEVREVLNCGIEASGGARVRPIEGGYRWLMYSDASDGSTRHGTRRGTFVPVDDNQCAFTMDRWYVARGLAPRYLPDIYTENPRLSDLPPLPREEDPLNPTGVGLDGVVDVDGDGRPGWAWQITGNFSGIRHVVARDWNAYATVPELPIPAHAAEFTTRATFDTQEQLLAVDHCGGACELFRAGSVPALDQPARVVFRYLGKALSDATVAATIAGPPRANVEVDLATCANVRRALSHEDFLESEGAP